MLRFSFFGIPVAIDWWFWIVCILLGGGLSTHGTTGWTLVGIWTLVVFVSIMTHELGHALAGKYFGARPHIKLHGFGGTTYLPGRHFTRLENIAVTAAGPLAGLCLGILVYFIAQQSTGAPYLLKQAYRQALFVNFAWTLFNLLPIQPLDGGQILREILGPRRLQVTSWIGFILASGLAVLAFLYQEFFIAILLAFLAFHNFRREPAEGGVVTG